MRCNGKELVKFVRNWKQLSSVRLERVMLSEGSWQQVYAVAKPKHFKDFVLKDGVE